MRRSYCASGTAAEMVRPLGCSLGALNVASCWLDYGLLSVWHAALACSSLAYCTLTLLLSFLLRCCSLAWCLAHHVPSPSVAPRTVAGSLSRMEFRLGVRESLGLSVDAKVVDGFFKLIDKV